ncbi:hypothetical protein BJ508DRAFT_315073 [Ascobolus immersus RN42]|uniref:C2H2-type domain-containing protein n=1 Tax=Ascobolus immersus RN42 TaxID=1160509 RepID=A0A3N4HCJ3_ASCIM|nr:hypothetical protein BJ508DRAFT_315073 [Ascobolus immersus RN42]
MPALQLLSFPIQMPALQLLSFPIQMPALQLLSFPIQMPTQQFLLPLNTTPQSFGSEEETESLLELTDELVSQNVNTTPQSFGSEEETESLLELTDELVSQDVARPGQPTAESGSCPIYVWVRVMAKRSEREGNLPESQEGNKRMKVSSNQAVGEGGSPRASEIDYKRCQPCPTAGAALEYFKLKHRQVGLEPLKHRNSRAIDSRQTLLTDFHRTTGANGRDRPGRPSLGDARRSTHPRLPAGGDNRSRTNDMLSADSLPLRRPSQMREGGVSSPPPAPASSVDTAAEMRVPTPKSRSVNVPTYTEQSQPEGGIRFGVPKAAEAVADTYSVEDLKEYLWSAQIDGWEERRAVVRVFAKAIKLFMSAKQMYINQQNQDLFDLLEDDDVILDRLSKVLVMQLDDPVWRLFANGQMPTIHEIVQACRPVDSTPKEAGCYIRIIFRTYPDGVTVAFVYVGSTLRPFYIRMNDHKYRSERACGVDSRAPTTSDDDNSSDDDDFDEDDAAQRQFGMEDKDVRFERDGLHYSPDVIGPEDGVVVELICLVLSRCKKDEQRARKKNGKLANSMLFTTRWLEAIFQLIIQSLAPDGTTRKGLARRSLHLPFASDQVPEYVGLNRVWSLWDKGSYAGGTAKVMEGVNRRTCHLCGMVFQKDVHLTAHHTKPRSCIGTAVGAELAKLLEGATHNGGESYTCKGCAHAFTSRWAVEVHLRSATACEKALRARNSETKEGLLTCKECARTFTSLAGLDHHLKSATACPAKGNSTKKPKSSKEQQSDTACDRIIARRGGVKVTDPAQQETEEVEDPEEIQEVDDPEEIERIAWEQFDIAMRDWKVLGRITMRRKCSRFG